MGVLVPKSKNLVKKSNILAKTLDKQKKTHYNTPHKHG